MSRTAWICVAACAVALGVASRRFGADLPPFVAAYAGDALWALLVFALAGILAHGAPLKARVLGSLVFACAIEFSQLYHAEWIDSIRATTLGALVLGHGFLWSDLVCYAAGILIGAAMEWLAALRA